MQVYLQIKINVYNKKKIETSTEAGRDEASKSDGKLLVGSQLLTRTKEEAKGEGTGNESCSELETVTEVKEDTLQAYLN